MICLLPPRTDVPLLSLLTFCLIFILSLDYNLPTVKKLHVLIIIIIDNNGCVYQNSSNSNKLSFSVQQKRHLIIN